MEKKLLKLQSVFLCKSVYDIFNSLEYMDEAFLNKVADITTDEKAFVGYDEMPKEYERALSNLANYFVFRIISPAESENELRARFGVVGLSISFIIKTVGKHLIENGKPTLDDISEIARLFSSEIEYSTENMEILISEFDFLLNF